MLNQSILVGKTVTEVEVKEDDNGEEVAVITVAVPRNYKNKDGLYDTDFIDCTLSKQIATNVKEYCSVGSTVGIKAYIEAGTSKEDKNPMKLVADKITFLSSKKEDME